jgi:hypothetical protein
MPTYQTFNKKTGAYVKYKLTNKGVKFTDVKQKEPKKPFKNIPIKGKKIEENKR